MRFLSPRHVIFGLLVLVALALPAIVVAAISDNGHFRGAEGVSFTVGRSPHGSPAHASGAVRVYQGARGHVAPQPFETHHWSAALIG